MLTAIGRFLSMLFPSRACGPAWVQAKDGKASVRKLRISYSDTPTHDPHGVAHGFTQKFIFVLPQHIRRERIQVRILGIVQPAPINLFAIFMLQKELRQLQGRPSVSPPCSL